ncbi:hypothetical protein G7K_6563-t1 [Saitoella complicata NRRL Y-17804]|uniref:Uncharacterized protein n=1 Tax=Saitoella complicata (strain BCRC 22490 / CBS 7301 / JCM 7358 / NBRC 10748 / NRRL Y-17804) TaxID=698492 RepID=A0A0E9NRS8_SAICN|nr:hypothetical protein G7K_6563-t1 [Saitoella complicata NRRL Y-17804]
MASIPRLSRSILLTPLRTFTSTPLRLLPSSNPTTSTSEDKPEQTGTQKVEEEAAKEEGLSGEEKVERELPNEGAS